MNIKLAVWTAVAVMALGASDALAQRGAERGSRSSGSSSPSGQSGTINYQDISRRNTQKSDRDERKEKAAEEAKKKAEEEKRRAERERRYGGDRDQRDGKGMVTKTADSKSTGSRGRGEGAKRATQPIIAGGSSDPTMKDVTEVMLNAVKTQKVAFDPAEAKNDPDVILLNAPKFDATQRVRAGDAGIAEPL